ncbi:MAG: leucine-rich repeat domain-containing protein [Clostridia bacterium]|nr:leucine-rich repeat domain-containing protein [Clostridia bacterium]
MKNKIFWILLTVSIICVFLPGAVSAETDGGEFNSDSKDPNGNPYICEWLFDEESEALYVEGVGTLPEMTAATSPWTEHKDTVENVVIEEGVKSIGKRGFASLPALKAVEFPDSLEYITMRAFEFCTGLEEITIPGTVKTVGDQTFLECSSLKTVVFEDGIEKLGCYLFGNCKSLEDVYVYGMDTNISRMRSNDADGVIFRGCDFDKLTAHCYEGSDSQDYFENDIYTITNWSNDRYTGEETEMSYPKKENSMTAGGYTLNVEYIAD